MKVKLNELKSQWERKKHRLSFFDVDDDDDNAPSSANKNETAAAVAPSATADGLNLFLEAIEEMDIADVPECTQQQEV